jgi:hypothetical protein
MPLVCRRDYHMHEPFPTAQYIVPPSNASRSTASCLRRLIDLNPHMGPAVVVSVPGSSLVSYKRKDVTQATLVSAAA